MNKEASLYSSMVRELVLGASLNSVPVYIGITSTLDVAGGTRTFSP